MKAIVCDGCKKIIKDNEIKIRVFNLYKYELCTDCKLKFDKIKDEYNSEINLLEKQMQDINEQYKNKLKEIGIGKE